jgi:hypothetical protein
VQLMRQFLEILAIGEPNGCQVGVGNPPLGKDTSLGQSLISKASRDVRFSEFPLALKGIPDLTIPDRKASKLRKEV